MGLTPAVWVWVGWQATVVSGAIFFGYMGILAYAFFVLTGARARPSRQVSRARAWSGHGGGARGRPHAHGVLARRRHADEDDAAAAVQLAMRGGAVGGGGGQ